MAVEVSTLRQEVTELLQELIRIDTTNPPGNETAAAELLRDYLEDAGVSCELYAKIKNSRDAKVLAASMKALGEVLEDGVANAMRFEQARLLMAEQRKHKDSEARRRAEIESNLTARQANAL